MPERTRLKFEFEALQYDGSHYSSELSGLSTVYLVKLIGFSVYLLYYLTLCKSYLTDTNPELAMGTNRRSRSSSVSQRLAGLWGMNWGNLHPVIWLLTAVIGLQVFSTALEYGHLLLYAANGSGLKGLTIFADMTHAISQVHKISTYFQIYFPLKVFFKPRV